MYGDGCCHVVSPKILSGVATLLPSTTFHDSTPRTYHIPCPDSKMPPPTSSLKPNAKADKTGSAKSAVEASGEDKKSGSSQFTKPDQAKYNSEQDAINAEITQVKSKLVSLL